MNPNSRIFKKLISALITVTMIITLFSISATPVDATSSGKYWLKINKRANVITAYKYTSGKWKPVRAMLCSTGTASMPTKSGTYRTSMKRRWLTMTLDGDFFDYAQYTCRLYGQVYIHSVWYYAPAHNAQATAEFNKLGTSASHGCVRVSTADAKWIYDNCPTGTKVSIYSSHKSGPLGKPKPIKVNSYRKQYWDPTDPAKGNPYYLIRKPILKVKKPSKVQYGSKFSYLKGVSAKDPNSFMNLNKYIKVYGPYKKHKGRYRKIKSLSTKNLASYMVKYSVKDPYGKRTVKTYKFNVVDWSKPVIKTSSKSDKITQGEKTNIRVNAKQASCSRTKAIRVRITTPDGNSKGMSLSKAKKYIFKEPGKYKIKYFVRNKYKKSKATKKYVTIYVAKRPEIPEKPNVPETSDPDTSTPDTSKTDTPMSTENNFG